MINPLSSFLGMFSHDIGIDLGTANTLVSVRGRGIVIDEPSVVAIDRVSKRVLAIGAEAKRMVGRTPSTIVAVRPMRDGVISDFGVTQRMLSYFIRSVQERFGAAMPRPRVVVGIPSGATEVEKRAVHEAALAIDASARPLREARAAIEAAFGDGTDDAARATVRRLEALGARVDVRRDVVLELSHFMSLLPVIASSDLVATVPADLARIFTGYAPVHVTPIPIQAPLISVHQFWHRRSHQDPAVVWLRGQVCKLFGRGDQSPAEATDHELPVAA